MTPGLSVYRSNRLEVLVELLAWLTQQPGQRPADPIAPLRVAVGNVGMAGWLEHRLAERWGVLANVELMFPARAFAEVERSVLGDAAPAPDADPWAPGALTWTVLEVLAEVQGDAHPDFAPLRDYLGADPHAARAKGGAATARAYGLARQIADVFDRYVTYRPALAIDWTEGRRAGELPPSLTWQPALWRRLADRIGGDHAAARALRLEAALREAPQVEVDQPLRVFGLSSLPPAMLHQATRLARRMPVELYLLCPSNTYWADLHRRRDRLGDLREADRDAVGQRVRDAGAEPRNPLLAAFGRVMRDFQIALEGLPDTDLRDRRDVFVDMAESREGVVPDDPDFPDPATLRPSALAELQSDVLHARQRAGVALRPGDTSLQFHACHGPTRQVEVLRDALLGLFAADPSLEPRDVVVMSPDIETFAPLISAVFEGGPRTPVSLHDDDWGPAGAPHVPYAVADLSLRRANPVAEALLRLLALPEDRLTAPALLELLGQDPIRRRFDIAPDQLGDLRAWIVESGMRWGADAADRAAEGQPADALNTLQFGLDRLLLGVCVGDEDDGALAGVRPFDHLAPSQTPLLGRLADLVARLVDLRDALRTPRPVADWIALLMGEPDAPGVLDSFTATDERAVWMSWKVHETLAELAASAEAAGQTRPIDVAALNAALAGRFDLPSSRGPMETGGVTFSSLVPMRGLPHRVVCLLGMDEGSFPRKPGRRAFDLVSLRPTLGDRDPADDDRGALLEAVLAARDHLLVLYTGRDPRSNEVCPPAVPIGELRDVIDATFAPVDGAAASAHLTRHHPLQPFSPRNFGEGGEPFGFDNRLARAARAARSTDRVERPFFTPGDDLPASVADAEDDGPATLELDTLARFLRAPHATLLRQRFGLFEVEDAADDVPDREPLDGPAGLELWQLQTDLLAGRLAGGSTAEVERRLRAAGRLPLGAGAEVALQRPRAIVSLLVEHLALLPPAEGEATIQRTLAERALVGHVGGLRGAAEVVTRFRGDGTSGPWTWVLAPWVRLLGRQLEAADPGASVVVLHAHESRGDLKPQWRSFALPEAQPVDAAADHLEALIRLYDAARERPLPLLPKGSFLFAYQAHKALPADLADDTEAVAEALAAADPDALEKAAKAVAGAWDPYVGRGDRDDPAVARLFGDRSPAFTDDDTFDPEFARVALAVWRPLVAARKTLRKVPDLAGGRR